MNLTIYRTVVVFLFLTLLHVTACLAALSVCDYEPPESRISDLGLQGTFNWYDGPFADDRNRAISASLIADYNGLFSSASFGQALDAHGEVRGAEGGWSAGFGGSGSLLAFLDTTDDATAENDARLLGNARGGDLFAIGVAGFDASTQTGLELDLTGGVGAGRFRDVTPLARAIQIQNDLLDLGELLAPVGTDTLLKLARTVGEIGPSLDDKVVQLTEQILDTGLVSADRIGVRGLLAIEEVLGSSNRTRLCGRDVQARIGVSAILLPELRLSTTGVLLIRYAAVPDPVSQLDSSVEGKLRLASPEEMSIAAYLSYARRLPNGWTARGDYRLSVDRMWTQPTETIVSHVLSGSLTTKIFGSVGLSFVGDAQYRTGDEELTLSLAVHMEADLF